MPMKIDPQITQIRADFSDLFICENLRNLRITPLLLWLGLTLRAACRAS
jgi:hypothetical protein